jgi:MYXO-CTERM domain-containing protein
LIFLAACAPDPKFVAARDAIINGMPSGTDDDAAIAIAILSSAGQFQGACSGSLIAPNLVLTARHCVAQVNEAGIACNIDGTPRSGGDVYADYDPANLKILVGADLTFNFSASGMQIIHNGATNLCNNDISLLLLDQPITTAPFAQIRLDSPPLVDETFRAVGWGVSNNSTGYGRRKRDNVVIEAVGPDTVGLGGIVSPNEFGVGEAICSGDSGGPAFDETTKAIIGMVSRGGNGAPFNPNTDPPYTPCVDTPPYTTFNLYTRTDSFKDLILSGFTAAGTDPWLEGGPDPRLAKFGVACNVDGDCRSGVCDKMMCSQSCDPNTPCPDGFVCGADGDRMNICVVPAPPSSCSTTPRGGFSGVWLLVAAVGLLVLRRRFA